MMQSLRKRLSIILILCTISAVSLSALIVNIAMNNTFNKYMKDVQSQRNVRIVEYFQQIYKKNGKWDKSSGEELMHEAYMGNYCLTLFDENKNLIWGMDPKSIKKNINAHMTMMQSGAGKGVYTSKTFSIKVNNKRVGYITIGQYNPILLSEQDVNFKNSINNGIIISAFIAILIITYVGLIISKQLSLPIRKVSDISVELSKGNYDARSEINSNITEINNLIESINMLGEKLRSEDLLRKRLLDDVSHEIRTPLNVLQNNLEAMIDGILPVTKEKLNNLNEEVIRFGKLLNGLSSLKQFERKNITLNLKPIYLYGLVSDISEEFMTLVKEKHIDMKLSIEPGEYIVLGDEAKLKQVFINILSNAIKFNKDNGKILINFKENRDMVFVQVEDNGIGIKDYDLPYIFERLYRGDKSRQEIAGSGIGLTIVKEIINLHSATIDVKSKVNKGTVVTICFYKKV